MSKRKQRNCFKLSEACKVLEAQYVSTEMVKRLSVGTRTITHRSEIATIVE